MAVVVAEEDGGDDDDDGVEAEEDEEAEEEEPAEGSMASGEGSSGASKPLQQPRKRRAQGRVWPTAKRQRQPAEAAAAASVRDGWMGREVDVPFEIFSLPGPGTYAGAVVKTSVHHVQLLFDIDQKSYWFKKANVTAWLREGEGTPTPTPTAPQPKRKQQHGRRKAAAPPAAAPAPAPAPAPAAPARQTVQVDEFEIEEHDSLDEFEITASAQPPEAARRASSGGAGAAKCEHCGIADRQLLICRGCRSAWHPLCLRPPLALPPRAGSWLCPPCDRAHTRTVAADWER